MSDLVGTREQICAGTLRGAAFARFIHARTDQEIEALLGIDTLPPGADASSGELIGYLPSGLEAITEVVRAVRLTASDTLVDIGAGAGKVAMVAHLLSGARVIGIERQAALVELAKRRTDALSLTAIDFRHQDARDALPEGDVYFLYLPFVGAALAQVMAHLEVHAQRRAFVVCALGLDLPRSRFLRPRPTESFWLTLYDAGR